MQNLSAREVFTNPVHLLAYGFGAGLSPRAPGTLGTVVAIPIYALLIWSGPAAYFGFLAVALVAGVFICGYTARRIGVDDPKSVVWDEVVGYLITMIGVPFGAVWVLAGFLLFRLFDIWKPWPIRWLDRNVKGGFGIMVDDVAAAIPACLILNLAVYLLKL
ncbi:MAG: phosphatidylglycerophosphatase A [Gammaproteobacteria bacterium]|jgi:phosphatidylglycerophosphatase A|nr:phosphatidylglycerophosphatase A [Gammaproteobacteria bacterium]